MQLSPGMCKEVPIPETGLVYTCEASESKYGFLDVSIGESVNIEFIEASALNPSAAALNPSAAAAISSKGGKRLNKKSKKRKLIKKSKKRRSMKRKG
jgi:hypothetical protein